MDLDRLRSELRPLIVGLSSYTHKELPSICQELGLPPPGSEEMTKAERMNFSFETLSDSDLPNIAERFLKLQPPEAKVRNKIQDVLWADLTSPVIPKKYRREISRAIESEPLYLDQERFEDLLERLWVLDDDPLSFFTGTDRSLHAAIHQHVFRNPNDWSIEYLFGKLGAFDATDPRFALFLEGLSSSDVRPDEAKQRQFVDIVNKALQGCGVELRETDSDGGYPVFRVITIHGPAKGRPKNLIFASSVKPDLRFRDAVNNDIEIVTNADEVLVYDRPINQDGLRWSDLQSWWADTNGIDGDDNAKKSLYSRLLQSLPKSSPPQRAFFDAYHRGFGNAIPRLPALLPEVWLHWDPKTVKERGPDALLRFRMDFLLLLPGGVRVVIEVDGRQHFAHSNGRADTARYASMVAADRDLKLAGYEVFRFGAKELQGKTASIAVTGFFEKLFRMYGVEPRT